MRHDGRAEGTKWVLGQTAPHHAVLNTAIHHRRENAIFANGETDVNVADLFTKALTPAVFERLMGLVSGDATMPEENGSVEHYVGRSLFMLDEIELN